MDCLRRIEARWASRDAAGVSDARSMALRRAGAHVSVSIKPVSRGGGKQGRDCRHSAVFGFRVAKQSALMRSNGAGRAICPSGVVAITRVADADVSHRLLLIALR